MAASQIVYSNDGEHLAYSSSDGVLRIFESATGTLKQEYSSSAHLSTTTTALSWSRQRKESVSTPKAKRRKTGRSTQDVDQDDLMLIALGTTAGTVDLYSFAKAELHTQLADGHASKINDLCWHLTDPELFSCSDDKYVIQWDLVKGNVKHKWKCDSSGIYSVQHCSQNTLLTASHTIKLWDISTRTLLQTFTGHSSPVFQLLPVCHSSSDDDMGSSYVLSAAYDDRHINVWCCNGSSADKNSIVTFSVPDEVVSMTLSKPSSSSAALLLAVITRKGTLHLFQHIFNGKKKKPLLCKVTVQAVSKTIGDTVKSVPIHACFIQDDRIVLATGNLFKLHFESMVYNPNEPEVIITVAEPVQSLMREEYSQVKRPEISAHVTTITPADSQPKLASKIKDKKRHRRSSITELTVEERLNAMSSDTPEDTEKRRRPLADTLSRLLQQGLLSGDAKILNGVFQEANDTVVRNTVKNLPLQCIVPLLDQIEKGLNGHAQKALNLSRFASALIACHTSYILSVPEVINKLNKLYQTLFSRQKFYPKMLQLKGRLDLVRRQGHSHDAAEDEMIVEPLLVHQDDSDDSDSMVIDGPVLESDENWEDLSDME